MSAVASLPYVVEELSGPDLSYETWREALRVWNDELAAQARADLLAWIDLGCHPRWTDAQRNAFYLVLP